MWHVSGHGKGKIGVALQIAALVMLLCSPHLPLLARALALHAQPGRCAMDHRLCGCAPERIASRTCCCFRNGMPGEPPVKPGSCDLRAKVHEHSDLDDGTPPASHRLSCLPCGQDPQMISQVAPEMKYMRTTWASLPVLKSGPHNTPPRWDSYLSPSLEPPVPPPKISIFV
jgi:hypothetical protein